MIQLQIGERCFNLSEGTFNQLREKLKDEKYLPDENKYLIDRDGDIFKYILRYLRGKIVSFPDDFKDGEMLMKEADYFGLGELKKHLTNGAGRPEVVSLLIMTIPSQQDNQTSGAGQSTSEPDDGIDVFISWTRGNTTNISFTWKTLFHGMCDKLNFTVHKPKNVDIRGVSVNQVSRQGDFSNELSRSNGSIECPYLLNIKDEEVAFRLIDVFLSSGFSILTDQRFSCVSFLKKLTRL